MHAMTSPNSSVQRQSHLGIKVAQTSSEIEQALRLRYTVFVEEEKNMRLVNEERLERDNFDTYCDHLIVTDLENDQVVGTYRLLPGERAVANIGFYSESEFQLASFQPYKIHTLELGRSCIAPEFRGSRVIQMLWEGIANYIHNSGHHYLIGCASILLMDIDDLNQIYTLLRHKGIITDRYGIEPHPTHRIQGLAELAADFNEKEVFHKLPPLMKGYQWLGAEIGGEPAYDEIFNTIDFFILLEKDRIIRKYRRHFLKP